MPLASLLIEVLMAPAATDVAQVFMSVSPATQLVVAEQVVTATASVETWQ